MTVAVIPKMKKQTSPNIQAHLTRSAFYLLMIVAMCSIPCALAQRNATSHGLPATIIVVTNTKDSSPGSLRDALANANDGDTIDATGVSGTILLTSGELQITHNVTINGPGAGSLAVNGNYAFRVFENFGSNVTISGFTITLGNVTDVNGGGGILNHGGLIVSDSIVSNSFGNAVAGHGGGGISNLPGATLTVTGSTITGNAGHCNGGGIYTSNAQLTVTN